VLLIYYLILLPPSGYQPGWPIEYTGSHLVSSGISFADIDGDGICEIITQIMYNFCEVGTLYVYDQNANLKWKFSNDTIIWLPAFGDIDNDGIDEMVVGTSKGIYAFNGDGSFVPDFPWLYPGCYCIDLTLADVDVDDSLEIVCFIDFPGDSAILGVFNVQGQPLPGWPITTPQYVYTHPAVADIDNDGYKEILYNTWLDSLYCYRYNGSIQAGFPVQSIMTPDCGPSEIVLCDIDHDNFIETLVGSCTPWADTGCLYIYRYDGTAQPGWPKYFSSHIVFHPDQYHFAVGDLDNDQEIEIVITGTGSTIRILDNTGSYLPGTGNWYSWGVMNPVIANIDFTPEKEIIGQAGNSHTTALTFNGQMCEGWPISTKGHVNYYNSLTVGDIDNDGLIEMGLVSGSGLTGLVVHVMKLVGAPGDIEWGCPYFDLQRTCYYRSQ